MGPLGATGVGVKAGRTRDEADEWLARSPDETSFVELFPAERRSRAPVNMRGMKYAPVPRTIDVLTGAS